MFKIHRKHQLPYVTKLRQKAASCKYVPMIVPFRRIFKIRLSGLKANDLANNDTISLASCDFVALAYYVNLVYLNFAPLWPKKTSENFIVSTK